MFSKLVVIHKIYEVYFLLLLITLENFTIYHKVLAKFNLCGRSNFERGKLDEEIYYHYDQGIYFDNSMIIRRQKEYLLIYSLTEYI